MKKNFSLLVFCFLSSALNANLLEFSGQEYGPPYRTGPYGCTNMRPIYSLIINFEKNTFTRIDELCYAGDWHYEGRQGIITWDGDKGIKTITHVCNGIKKESIIWHEADYSDGHFVVKHDADGIDIDETSRYGNIVHWSNENK